jgi:hypothetical protein
VNQEFLADSIGISARELQRWEADRHNVRTGNLHDKQINAILSRHRDLYGTEKPWEKM